MLFFFVVFFVLFCFVLFCFVMFCFVLFSIECYPTVSMLYNKGLKLEKVHVRQQPFSMTSVICVVKDVKR